MYKSIGAVCMVLTLGLAVAWGQGATSTSRPILTGPLATLDIKAAQVEAVQGKPKGTLTIAQHFALDPGLLDPLEFVSPSPDQARVAGRWRAAARAKGRALGLADALIAASADALDASVLTRNARDFRLTPVRVVTY